MIHASELKLQHFEVFPYVCTGKPYVCNVSAHALREWAWPRALMNVTTFTRFADNCHIGSLVALYGSTMHGALSPGAIPSTAKLGMGIRL